MRLKAFFTLLLFISTLTFAIAGYWDSHSDEKVLLKDVQVLTLYRGKMTTGSRSSPVPQLKCVGGSARGEEHKVQTVQCYNRGSDGSDVQWECKAELPSSIKFGNINVGCEGYSYPNDPYILKGSCGLEYTLDYEDGHHRARDNYHHNDYYSDERRSSGGIGGFISFIVFGFIVYMVYKSCAQQAIGGGPGGVNNGGYGGPFYGGGGGGPGFGPTNSYYGGANCAPSAPPMQQGWRPGFWTGMATGGLLGRMFGNRNYGANYYRPAFGGGGGSFGGGGGSTRSSSGFGGTSRR
eukprot:TRINITY_DN5855_c0_g1_i1.p1 TRINITY_DN5855_c0_g1~~TRINITY_DN5855_c0_g1_i1.p1  ORF type:complete len:293 (-),score=41.55 TRINITY_DN5855_c0_g1_i1:245-1123(-)